MTEIYGKDKKSETKVILSSKIFEVEHIARSGGDQPVITEPKQNIDEIIRLNSTEDPFKFIPQKKNRASSQNPKSVFKMYRQGDILFKKIDALPEGLKIKSDNIVAGGEGSTHAHMLVNGELFQAEYTKQKYISSHENTRLIHEEHLPIKLESGNYEVVRQREYLGPGLEKRERLVTD
ncbi:MAG: hypothetical protein ACFE96_04780 [Candidatus Hermodarchaeota archaeon]